MMQMSMHIDVDFELIFCNIYAGGWVMLFPG